MLAEVGVFCSQHVLLVTFSSLVVVLEVRVVVGDLGALEPAVVADQLVVEEAGEDGGGVGLGRVGVQCRVHDHHLMLIDFYLRVEHALHLHVEIRAAGVLL